MPFKLQESDWQQFANNRKSRRNAVQISAELRLSSGQKFKVLVCDLSQTGFRIETGNHIDTGTKLYLALPNLNSLPAQVAWNDRTFYGCVFLHPLHASVFEHIVAQHPSLRAG